jgi:hypothetical protein
MQLGNFCFDILDALRQTLLPYIPTVSKEVGMELKYRQIRVR